MKLNKRGKALLVGINFIVLILMAGDCSNLKTFVMSKIILGSIFLLNNVILYKKSDFFVEE